MNNIVNETTYHHGKNGRIETHIDLVTSMVDEIPQSAWISSTATFCFPGCGKGSYVIDVIKRLRKCGHSKKNIVSRIWVYDTSSSCRNGLIKTLGDDTNVGNDFLKANEDIKFDFIIGNPPYQAPQTATGKRGGGDLIWPFFVDKSNRLLNQDGYLIMVHPAGWRKPRTKGGKYNNVWKILTEDFAIEYLSIHNLLDGQNTFGVTTRYDWYIAKKGKVNNCITVRGEDGVIFIADIDVMSFIPNMNFDDVKQMLPTTNEKTGDVIFSCNYETRKVYVTDVETAIYKFPLIHSTPKGGVRYMYSSCNNKGHFGISKVIFGEGGAEIPVEDVNGVYGMTQCAMAIEVADIDDANKLISFLQSDLYKKIINSCSWSNYRIDWRLFTHFKEGFWR